ncbi:MAG TPA: ROK family protein [Thermoleophilaceae bacterium]
MRFVLALDFGGTKIDLGTARLDGELILSERIETHAERGARQAVERAIEAARALAERTDGECLGAGAVSPGIVENDRVLLAPNVPGWDELPLPALLRDGLGSSSVAVANDVNAAALAESRWGALAGSEVGVFLSLGTGVKAGLVIGGKVFEGAHRAAGEIGYSLRDPADGVGYAAGQAPFEEFVGGRALGRRASALVGAPVSAADVFAHPDLPTGFLQDWLAELTMHVANLAIALDPERIALGGGLMAHAETILPALRDRLAAAVPFPPEVVPARFLQDGALRGAAALAIDAVGELVEEAR